MTSENMKVAQKAMELRAMCGLPFKFRDLHSTGDAALRECGWTRFEDQNCYRAADRLIQRLRKAGRIAQTGKRGVWLAAPVQS